MAKRDICKKVRVSHSRVVRWRSQSSRASSEGKKSDESGETISHPQVYWDISGYIWGISGVYLGYIWV